MSQLALLSAASSSLSAKSMEKNIFSIPENSKKIFLLPAQKYNIGSANFHREEKDGGEVGFFSCD